jgi:hemolysin-activating ACP:hemolysin acyltransferase
MSEPSQIAEAAVEPNASITWHLLELMINDGILEDHRNDSQHHWSCGDSPASIHAAYIAWAHQNSVRRQDILSQNDFAKEIMDHGFVINNDRVRGLFVILPDIYE